MLQLEITGQFKRDYKRENAGQHTDLERVFRAATGLLANGSPLSAAHKDHPLRGEWKGYRDCHLIPTALKSHRMWPIGVIRGIGCGLARR